MKVREDNLHESLPHDYDDADYFDQEVVNKERPIPEKYLKSMEDDLTLAQLSNSKTTPPTPSPPTPSPSSQGKRKKSSRMKDKLSLTKKKKLSGSKLKIIVRDPAGKCLSIEKGKAVTKGLSSGQVRSPAIIRAEEVQSSLGPEFPSFIKVLVRSHVASCFWMGLPVPFCKLFLPRKTSTVVLENESGEQFEIKYIADKTGLSSGWRKFAIGHNLLEGDVLIFHLVGCYKFKVYIVRANDLTQVDGALSLINLDSETQQNDADGAMASPKINKRKRRKSLPLTVIQKKKKRTSLTRSVLQIEHPLKQFRNGNDGEEVGSEVLEGSKISEPVLQFKDVKSFEDFRIVVDGLCIDSELPEHVRMNYYELCCSKKAFLHDRLPKGLYNKLVAGIIGETVSIANEIRACKLTTSRDAFAVWENSLNSFELLGMNVGFLRDRLRRLLSLAFESEVASDVKRYIEAKAEQSCTEDEIRNFEEKLVELKEASGKFDAVIGGLKHKAERYQFKFQEAVDAPW